MAVDHHVESTSARPIFQLGTHLLEAVLQHPDLNLIGHTGLPTEASLPLAMHCNPLAAKAFEELIISGFAL